MTLTLRSASTSIATTKGSSLTHAEMDANWLHTPAQLASSSGSSLVGFLQSGSGAIERKAQNRFRDTVHVKDFMTETQVSEMEDLTSVPDISTALQNAFNKGAHKIDLGWGKAKITSKITWTGPRDFIGHGPKSTELVCNVNDWSFDNSATTGRSLSVRHMKLTGDQTKASNAGVRVFDNGDRPFEHLEINGFSKAGLRVIQSVNPILRSIRAYNCATSAGEGIIELDKGATSLVSPVLEGVYLGSGTNGLLFNGASNINGNGVTIEGCTNGINATDSSGQINCLHIETTTNEYVQTDSLITFGFVPQAGAGSFVATNTYSGAAGWSRKHPWITPGFGGVYNTDDRTVSGAGAWTDCLLSTEFPIFNEIQVPFDQLRIEQEGVWVATYSVTFFNSTGAAISMAARMVKGQDPTYAEVQGSYRSATVPAGGAVCAHGEAIVDFDYRDSLKLQFCSDSASGAIGKLTTGLAAATHSTNATLTVRFLMAKVD